MEFGHVKAIARTAYIFTFPLVVSYGDLYAQLVATAAPSRSAGSNTPRDPSASKSAGDDRSGEMLQASLWVDLRTEPRMVTVRAPAVSLRVSDLWGFDVAQWALDASPPTQAVLLVSPAWMGEIAQDVAQVVRGESPFLRLVVSAQDCGVTAIELPRLVALASPGGDVGGSSPEPSLGLDWVPWSAGDVATNHYWACANFALSLVEPHADDQRVLDRIGEVGVVAGEPWDAGWFASEMLEAISAGMDQALSDLMAAAAGPLHWEHLARSRADFDHDYFGRALRVIADPQLSRATFPEWS